jgi:hypothetical protein
MSQYRVSFFKYLLNSDGHQFRCLQQSIVIHRAKNIDRAVEAAKRRYERRCHVHDWSLYADSLELQVSGKTSVISPPAVNSIGANETHV